MSSLAAAEQLLSVEITSNQDSAIPIAVVPFGGRSADGTDIAEIVQADLARTGEFSPLSRDKMLSRPTSTQALVLRDWRVLKSDFVLVGKVQPKADKTQVEFTLVDVATGKVVKTSPSQLTGSNERALAHYISDLVYEAITDQAGFFSSEVLYVAQTRSGKVSTYELQKADADGFAPTTLLRSNEPILSPTWAPDGKHIAYVAFESSKPIIYFQNLESGEKRKLASYPGLNGAPSFSPDGQYLAMTLSKDGNPEIYTVDLQSGQLNRMTNHFAIDTEPTWSADGKHIVFTSDRGGNPQIYKLDVAGKRAQRLTYEGVYNAGGKLTNDGRHLVMVHQQDGDFHIAVQDMQYGGVRVLSETGLDESPTISPNGKMVMFGTKEGQRGLLSMVSMDGRTKIRLPSRIGEVREPAWSPLLH